MSLGRGGVSLPASRDRIWSDFRPTHALGLFLSVGIHETFIKGFTDSTIYFESSSGLLLFAINEMRVVVPLTSVGLNYSTILFSPILLTTPDKPRASPSMVSIGGV